MRVRVDYEALAESIMMRGRRFITVGELSRMLGISTKASGKLLRRMEERGLVRRYSVRAYILTGAREA